MKIEITPYPKPRMTRADKWKQRECVMKYWAFKNEVREQITELPQPCKITFYLPMPSSWSATKKALMQGRPHQNKPDIDNLLKGLFDAIYEDDKGIWNVHSVKLWDVNGFFIIESLGE